MNRFDFKRGLMIDTGELYILIMSLSGLDLYLGTQGCEKNSNIYPVISQRLLATVMEFFRC